MVKLPVFLNHDYTTPVAVIQILDPVLEHAFEDGQLFTASSALSISGNLVEISLIPVPATEAINTTATEGGECKTSAPSGELLPGSPITKSQQTD
jgi:hypothetical protein